jgi:CDP-diacylglycerol--glycerol-3-phosphate 3-phosphatidyltransferase
MPQTPSPQRPSSLLPNLLSLSRIVLGVAVLILLPRLRAATTAVCLGIVVLSAATDYLDGRIARRTSSVSLFGKWIDPLSDFAFFLLIYISFYRIGLMPLVLLVLFLARELTMYGVIRTLYTIRRLDPGARLAGKVKTALQILGAIAVLVLLLISHRGLLERANLKTAAVVILSCLVAVSLGSLPWYVLPLVRSRRRR